jgi:hypothetical protein
MTASNRSMTRYLLGTLSEDERAALERRYFEDPRLFEELVRVEAALVDDYVAGRLADPERQRFETFYLAHPQRRERAAFAAALASRLDRTDASAARGGVESRPSWLAPLDALRRPRAAAAIALAALLVVSGLVWYAAGSRRPDRREATAGSVPPAAVTLALLVDPDVRGHEAGPPATLIIPPGTEEVRLELNLRERDSSAYRIEIRPVGGGTLLQTEALAASSSPGPAFTLRLPAGRLPAGDYLLTLQGGTGDGGFEDLSRTLFRIETP